MTNRTYFTYKIKYQKDWIHFNTPFDIQLESLTWIPTDMTFVCQDWEEILTYLEYEAENEETIRTAINNETIKADYTIVEKTVEEAKTFIDTLFWEQLINSEIVWDTVEFEVTPLDII